jgi:hypothetical protein
MKLPSIRPRRSSRRLAAISTAIALSAGSAAFLSEDASRLLDEFLPPAQPVQLAADKKKDLTVTDLRGLRFDITGGDHDLAGTATINAVTGAKTVSGGAHDFGGLFATAQFRVEGRNRETIQILLPSNVTVTFLGRTMTVNNFTHDCSNPCVLGNNGRREFQVGGRLNLAANQARGLYHGEFTVTVNYAP